MENTYFKKWLLTLLPEIFGATDLEYGYILDNGHAGILGTIDTLDAAAASKAPKPGAETIASHSGHTLYLMELFSAYSNGETPQADWPGSWKNQSVDPAAWSELRTKLRARYEEILDFVSKREEWNEDVTASSMILLGHCAYHLGEIKQLYSSTAQ